MSSSFLLFISLVIRENSCGSTWDAPGSLKHPDAKYCIKKRKKGKKQKKEKCTPSQGNFISGETSVGVEIKGEKLWRKEARFPFDFHL